MHGAGAGIIQQVRGGTPIGFRSRKRPTRVLRLCAKRGVAQLPVWQGLGNLSLRPEKTHPNSRRCDAQCATTHTSASEPRRGPRAPPHQQQSASTRGAFIFKWLYLQIFLYHVIQCKIFQFLRHIHKYFISLFMIPRNKMPMDLIYFVHIHQIYFLYPQCF